MAIITNLENFLKYIPTAKDTDWNVIEPYVSDAEAAITASLLGADLVTHISATDGQMKTLLCRMIAYEGYKNAIPFNDLLPTPNGFGIVSDPNVKPASKERVERLIQQCEQMVDKSTDLLIMTVMTTTAALTEWAKFSDFGSFTNCLFITGIDYARYCGNSSLNRAELMNARSELLFLQNSIIAEAIRREFLDLIISQIRSNTLTADNKIIVERCKQLLGKLKQGLSEYEARYQAKELITVYIYDNIEKYPVVAAADAAAASKTKNVNTADQPTFFFGQK